MGCPTEVEIGDNLVFSVTTHDPDTGVLTNADAVPAYRIYEDETATAILTGNMSALDSGSTTGFYTESIHCSTGNGFENGKTYTVYIEATVDSDEGGICYGFKAYDVRKVDVRSWIGIGVTLSDASFKPQIDVYSISDDSTAANNCELFFDGTGYAGTNNVIPTVTTLAGHTVQTGDSYALANGATGFAAIDTVVDSILVDTTVIGALGAGLTDLGGMSTGMKAEVQVEANDAIIANNLDHLAKTAVANNSDMTAEVADGTILSNMLSASSTTSTYAVGDNSLQAIGDASGGSTSPPSLLINTTIATLASQTSFTLTAGSPDDDAYNHRIIVVTDASTANQISVGVIKDYTGSTRTVTMEADPGTFTIATTDTVDIMATVADNVSAGSISHAITITDTGTSPVDNAQVHITSDAAGANIVQGPKYSDSLGVVTFQLDAGTYYAWREHSGYTWTNPLEITVA